MDPPHRAKAPRRLRGSRRPRTPAQGCPGITRVLLWAWTMPHWAPNQLSPPLDGRPAPELTRLPSLRLQLLIDRTGGSWTHVHPEKHTVIPKPGSNLSSHELGERSDCECLPGKDRGEAGSQGWGRDTRQKCLHSDKRADRPEQRGPTGPTTHRPKGLKQKPHLI